MTELLHSAAVLPAAVGACCTAGRRRAGVEAVVAVLMLLAMADLALGAGALPTVAWSALLLLAGLAIAVAERMRTAGRADGARTASARSAGHALPGMGTLAALGALVMAGQMLAMGAEPGGGAHEHSAGLLLWCTTGGGLLYAAVALGRLRAVRGSGGRAVVARLELSAMAGSVALMSLAALS